MAILNSQSALKNKKCIGNKNEILESFYLFGMHKILGIGAQKNLQVLVFSVAGGFMLGCLFEFKAADKGQGYLRNQYGF